MLFNPGNGCGCCTTVATSSTFPSGNGSLMMQLRFCNGQLPSTADCFIGASVFLQSGTMSISGYMSTGTNNTYCFPNLAKPGTNQTNAYKVSYILPSSQYYGYQSSGTADGTNWVQTTPCSGNTNSNGWLQINVPMLSGWQCCNPNNGSAYTPVHLTLPKPMYLTFNCSTTTFSCSSICTWGGGFGSWTDTLGRSITYYTNPNYYLSVVYNGCGSWTVSTNTGSYNFTQASDAPVNLVLQSGDLTAPGQIPATCSDGFTTVYPIVITS